MIKKLEYNDQYLNELESKFEVVNKKNVNQDILDNGFTRHYTYIIDSKAVAYINYYVMYERAELININVEEDYQDKKIASILMEKMIKDCIDNNVTSITLEVKKTNDKAIHLYEKYGFKEIGIRKNYYQVIDAILMEKELM